MITDKIIESNSGVVSLKGVLTDSNLTPKLTTFTMSITLIKFLAAATNSNSSQ